MNTSYNKILGVRDFNLHMDLAEHWNMEISSVILKCIRNITFQVFITVC